MLGSILSSIVPTAHAAVDAAAFGNVVQPIIDNIVMPLVELAFAVAVFFFAYGAAQFILHQTDADARKKGGMAIMGGLIGMLVMISAWGILHLVANTVKQF